MVCYWNQWLANSLEVEEPQSSCLRDCPYVSHVLLNLGPPAFFRRMWMATFGHWCAKPTQLFGTWHFSWTLVGLVLLRNLIGCWACVQLTPLCVIQHQGPSQFVSKFLWPSSESRICDFHALVLGAAGSFKPDCRRSGIPQSLHWLQQQVFKLPSKRAPRSKRSIGDVKWLDLLMFFLYVIPIWYNIIYILMLSIYYIVYVFPIFISIVIYHIFYVIPI